MKKGRQHIISFFFAGVILMPIIAITFLQLAQAYVKTNREERLETEKLEQVVLPANDVVWEEDGKELWVGDRMFDVASFKIVDGNYHLTGVYDDDETEIAGSLFHSLISKDGNNLLHFLLLLQCFTCCFSSINPIAKYCLSNKKQTFYFLHFPHPYFLVLVPPPRQ